MPSVLVLASCCALVFGHSSLHSKNKESTTNAAIEIDRMQLTSPAILSLAQGLENIQTTAGGAPIVLTCRAAYTPAATFMWTFNGKPIQGNSALNIEEKMMNMGKPIVESGMLASSHVITCPSSENSGTYKCIATNGHKTIESSAEIEIEGVSHGCNAHSKPSIVQWTDSRFEMETNTATLICRSDKPSEITWRTEEGKPITSGGRYEILSHGDLMIKNIRWEDTGSYICMARNKYGHSEEAAFLYSTDIRTL